MPLYGALAALLQLLSQFRGPVLSLSGLWTRFAAVDVAGERLAEILELPEQAEHLAVKKPRAIVFENVTFRYPDGEETVLENFSLDIPFGTHLAIVGETGAGKTNTAMSILNLVPNPPGKIKQGSIILGIGTYSTVP